MQNGTGHSIEDTVSRKEYDDLYADYQYLKHQLEELKRMIFGSKSERFAPNNDGQLSLFNQEEQTNEPEAQKEEITYSRTKKKAKNKAVRAVLPAHLPRKEEIIEPENIPSGAKKIGEEVTEILEYNPANIYVRKIVRPKYARPNNDGVDIAELPTLPLPKANAGASMLAFINVSKFIDHLPFYRQIQILKRQGLILNDSTLNGWFNATANLLEPLYACLTDQIKSAKYLQADESPIGVQDSHKKGALHNGYDWLFHAPEEGIVVFLYNHGRGAEVPDSFLRDFYGTLQTDGYAGYGPIARKNNMLHLACMAHARRKFEKALKNDTKRAEFVLKKMQLLYEIERKCRDKNTCTEVRKRYRQLYARPVLNEIEAWLKQNITEVLPKSAIGNAIAYTLNLWPRLKSYPDDGKYEIDNNLIENAVRPLALGRKNYLFAGSHDAAQRAAMMYSFFATCKINGVNPQEWLTDILNRILDHKANKLHELLPQNWKTQRSTAK